MCLLTCISDGLSVKEKHLSFFVSCRPATTSIMQHLLVSVETQMEEIHVEDSLRTQSNNMFFLPTYNIYNVLVNSAFQSDSTQYLFSFWQLVGKQMLLYRSNSSHSSISAQKIIQFGIFVLYIIVQFEKIKTKNMLKKMYPSFLKLKLP